MASPDLELQGVIVARLKGRPALTALVGQRIYDRPPTNAPFPYVEYGESDVKPADVGCLTSDAVYVTIHVWSQYSGGFKELKDIMYEIVKALDRAPLTEFILAAHGWSEANGAKKEIEPPSEDELDDLIKKYGG